MAYWGRLVLLTVIILLGATQHRMVEECKQNFRGLLSNEDHDDLAGKWAEAPAHFPRIARLVVEEKERGRNDLTN